jgi:alkylation response protein AidB-like acyl-CoA dehydrogenase
VSLPDEPALARLQADLAADAAAIDRDAVFPHAAIARLARERLLALTAPCRHGGGGAGLAAATAVLGRVARAEASTALVLAMQYHVHATMAGRWPDAAVERIARSAARDGALINALRVEPALGTPARGGLPATVARRVAGGWRLDGHKIYSTGAPALTWLAVWARTDDAEPLVGNFLVPAAAPGVRIVESWNHLGMRGSGSHDVILEDVALPPEAALELRPPAAWSQLDPVVGSWIALVVAAVYDGIARAAQDWLVRFLQERAPSNLGAPLATLPRFQEGVGAVAGLLAVNARLIASAAADTDLGLPPPASESALLKSAVTNNAIAAVELALKLAGNPGLSRDNPLEGQYRDVLCGRVHTPQDDMAQRSAGRAALGVAA